MTIAKKASKTLPLILIAFMIMLDNKDFCFILSFLAIISYQLAEIQTQLIKEK